MWERLVLLAIEIKNARDNFHYSIYLPIKHLHIKPALVTVIVHF